jgi:hypothetical protein
MVSDRTPEETGDDARKQADQQRPRWPMMDQW